MHDALIDCMILFQGCIVSQIALAQPIWKSFWLGHLGILGINNEV